MCLSFQYHLKAFSQKYDYYLSVSFSRLNTGVSTRLLYSNMTRSAAETCIELSFNQLSLL